MNPLEAWLHEATTMLQLPVVAALVVLLAGTLFAVGGFLREALDRRGTRRHLLLHFDRLAGDTPSPAAAAARCEVEASRRVAQLQLVARAGPTLGLMATLIPMGPALLALADNDVGGLARSLVVAFTATVVGLLVGLLCAAMGSVRRHWYAADLGAIDERVDDAPQRTAATTAGASS